MVKRGVGGRQGKQEAAAVTGDGSRREWLGCGLFRFSRRRGESLLEHREAGGGWFAEH